MAIDDTDFLTAAAEIQGALDDLREGEARLEAMSASDARRPGVMAAIQQLRLCVTRSVAFIEKAAA